MGIEQDATEVRTAGRNSMLIEERNELMAARLYWYRNFTDLRHEVVMGRLSHEFHLTKIRLAEVLQDNVNKLIALKKEMPTRKYFNDRWDHFKW